MTTSPHSLFLSIASALNVRVDDHMLLVPIKEFSTGSVGWYASGKYDILVGTEYRRCQVAVTVTVIGSKKLATSTSLQMAPSGPDPILLGPTYPYNEIAPQEATEELVKGDGVETASHDENGKMRRRPKRRAK